MPTKTHWHDQEKNIVYTQLSGDISLEELIENDREIHEFVVNGDEKVHVICDVQEMGKSPNNIADVKRSSDIYLKHENMGMMVVVGKFNPVIRFLANVISQMAKVQLTQVATIQEAEEYIERHTFVK